MASSPRVKSATELGPTKSGAIGFLQVDGLDPVKLGNWMMSKYRIVNTPIVHPEFSGIRITPSIYTTVDEIDTFVGAVQTAIRTGIA
jgi:selenocysteine lyase/cysteine desulfurase